MATAQYSSNLDHTSTAGFRAWVQELSTNLQTVMTKTSDTGQIDPATVNLPTNNTAGGYEIYRFNDSLQSTRPIFIKFEYGTQTAGLPQIWVTVGIGTNGAGVMTGISSNRSSICGTTFSVQSTTIAYNTLICCVPGFFGLGFKLGANNQNGASKGMGAVFINRSCDDTGAITGNGVAVMRQNVTVQAYWGAQYVDFINNLAYQESTDGSTSLVIQNRSTSLVGTDVQVYKNYVATPRVRPLFGVLTVLTSEVSALAQFSIIPVGTTTTRNFISFGSYGNYAGINSATISCYAMLWE